MQLKTLALAALAAFAFGAGINAAPAEAAVNCFDCHNSCDMKYDACLIAGTDPSICASSDYLCRRRCGCPTP